ncbi:TonB-dependent receptor [Sphingopyxis panaciterrulae]|uniref:Outer membrane receptor protein involved in Fe transport n=1 Tax=Sphingopyxis panaciterrulae TaxID=462372 RepID=A0A7W9B8N0_9SPHN|nr:TonB-dependent receptor [Sphingopyxis panaciterrulae]MBB5708228.1 outer membrane receptor protein involved in Fe transport [Sphingopyxis panaciterrulae]
MSKKRCYLSASAFAALAAASVAMPSTAFAQASDQPGAGTENAEIIVTAQRREQSLQDVPISIAVASGETLRESQVSDLSDLGNRISGVKINSAGASDSLNIRGIGSGFNMGFEQAVGIFVDGVYVARSQVIRGGFLDLERIEVLKGPQSTYFGSNTIAGALSIVTKKPSQNFEGYVSALYSPSDDEYDVQAAVGGPLADGLSMRGAFRLFGMGGYIKNLRLDNRGPNNSDIQARLALRYETPGALDVNLRIDYAKYDDKHTELQEIVNCPPAPGYGAGPNFDQPAGTCAGILVPGDQDNKLNYVTASGDASFELEAINGALDIAVPIGGHTLTSTTGYYYHDLFRTTVSGASFALPAFNLPVGLPLSQPEKFRSFSQELRFESDKGGLVEYMLGLYYDNSNMKGAINTGFYFSDFGALANARAMATGAAVIPTATPVAQEVYGDQDQSNRSIFAAATVNLSDAFRVNLGARYSSIRKEAHRTTRAGRGDAIGQVADEFSPEQFNTWATTVGRVAGDYRNTKRTDEKFMPSVNIQYDVTPDVMLYASFATGFKAGGWSIGQNLDEFDPETVKSYEAGIKASWLDRRLTTNITIFNSDYDDLQESTTIIDANGINQSVIANVGKARARGVDLEIGVRPFTDFSLSANIGYLDAKYLDYANAPCPILPTDPALVARIAPICPVPNLGGGRKAYAPKWSGSVSANYSTDLSSDLKLKLGSWLYFSSRYFQQANVDLLTSQPGYAKLDLRASIGSIDDRWEFGIVAKNVTDKATGNYRAAMTGSNAVAVRVDRSRSIAFQLSTRF